MDCPSSLNGGLAYAPPCSIIQSRGRTFLNDFLVAPLDRTLPVIEMHHLAILISKDLNLYMAGSIQVFLNVEPRITKRRGRFGADGPVGGGYLLNGID